MDSKDEIQEQMYEVIADIFSKGLEASKIFEKEEKDKEINNDIPKERRNTKNQINGPVEQIEEIKLEDEVSKKREEKVKENNQDISSKKEQIKNPSPESDNITFKEKENELDYNSHSSGRKKVGILSRIPYKDLSETKEKLAELKKEMNKDKGKYQKEIAKVEKVEKKLDFAMKKQKIREVDKNINKLKHNPRFYVMRVIETKGKLDTLKVEMEKDPDMKKEQFDKLGILETKLNAKIEKMKTSQLNKSIDITRISPRKFNSEINKYKEIERKLNSQKDKLVNQIDKSKSKDNGAEKEKGQKKVKAAELSM